MQAGLPLNPSDSARGVSPLLETQCNQAMARSRQSQIVGLISAIAAAAMLLLLVVALSVPGFPVAATLVAGSLLVLSIIALTASFLVYIANAQLVAIRIKLLSTELQDYFSESSIVESIRKGLDTSVPVVLGQPDDPLPNRIGIKSTGVRVCNKNILVACKKYKQCLEKVGREFSLVCEGISDVIPTAKEKPCLIEVSHLAGVFLFSFSPDKNPILKITRHAEKMLQSQDGVSNGTIWLCGALADPQKYASPFLSLLEKTRQGILANPDLQNNQERKLALEAALLTMNIFLSGWCLGNPEHNQYVATQVAESYKDSTLRNRILDLLGTGNVISALALASAQNLTKQFSWASGIQKVLREDEKENRSKQEKKEEVCCLYSEIDPCRCLGALPKQFESRSPDGQEPPAQQLTKLLKDFNDAIPSGVIGVIAKASSSNLQADFAGVLDTFRKLQVLFENYPPLCEQNILLWLKASLEQVGLQRKLRTFLPSSERKLLEKVLSIFVLGLYVRGMFSVGQVEQLAKICNAKDSTCFARLVNNFSLIRTALPTLFN
ncbi:hypothetical protein C6H88_02500 [Chlamydia muridarum str. Nigg]|uniref:Inclusion membrane protein n=2 Tax=Chlamydia muridarum TaxID=83560 RepID=Q9PKH9_CHLMU|nr:hypothetical protein [Chlamydia muridarum]UFW99741.1 hypothetical protein FTM85_02605 [Chlamydia trachomatis]AAF39332.1 hypothetical protein TC_0486 [Chlamydia muridarum str. Nigg]AHH22873.1 putative inclusion membrane protein [Chlamydia muridarum str. Nigg3 CMUT3-5]AHH23798.1 putative inclusion membrane protein [Chlamydia muridarum str. Nigg CM972]AID38007.1 putative inclusion membrane protein [Chlamydia muridarum str. Nigg 2 MCR]